MRLLLDSHLVVWALLDDPRLKPSIRERVVDRGNDVLVSAATVWELEIKRATGRLEIDIDLIDYLSRSGFAALPIIDRHSVAAARLPPHHRDPFDRMLVAQARLEALTLVTADRTLDAYDVDILPA